jgi:TPR repeat protein
MKVIFILILLISNAFSFNSLYEIKSKAQDGNPAALYNLGLLYSGYNLKINNRVISSDDIPKSHVKAFKCFKQAAQNIGGYMFADELAGEISYMLGKCYSNGHGVNKNPEMAFKVWKIGADGGNADAQYEISKCYAEGRGVQKNIALSKQWLNRAAKNGSLRARASQGDLGYFLGLAAKKLKEEGGPIIKSIKDGYNNSR